MQIFAKDDHRIIEGEIIEVLKGKEISDESIDLIFADPPYNIGKDFNGTKEKWDSDSDYLKWCYNWMTLLIKKLKPTGSLYIMTATQFMPYFDMFLSKKLNIVSRIIWNYDSSGVQATKAFGSLYEPILHCVKNKNKYVFNSDAILVKTKTGAERNLIDYRKNPPAKYNHEKVPGNVWNFSRVRYKMSEYETHPTQKPIQLLERIIKTSSNINSTVLDVFSGTFTTAFVAKSLNRKSISVEQEHEYVKIGLRRVLNMLELNGEELLNKKNKPMNITTRRKPVTSSRTKSLNKK